MKKGFWWGIGIALAAAVSAGAWWWTHRAPALRWRMGVIEKGSIQVSVTATGTLQAVTTVAVGTQVSGAISALYADFNSRVKKGQVIARIDTTLLYAALLDAQSSLTRAEAQDFQARANLNRTRPLFEKELVSQSDLEAAEANAKVAAATLASARAGVERALINLSYATIVSPIDGIVLSRAVDIGQTVAASFNTPTLFSIAGDLREMQVLASVDEADIGRIRAGQPCSFTVDAYPDTLFSGEVEQVRLQPIISQNVVTYNVVVRVGNPDFKLMPGMTANLTIVVAQKDGVLLVPASALRFQPPVALDRKKVHPDSFAGKNGEKNHRTGEMSRTLEGGRKRGRIFDIEKGKLTPFWVFTGLSDGVNTEITGPLEEGDSIVLGLETSSTASSPARPFGLSGGGRGGHGIH